MTSYAVTVTRDDNLWVAVIDGLSPGATDVERLADLEVEVRDLIAGLTDTDPDAFAIHWRYEVNGVDVTDKLGRFLAVDSELRDRMKEREALRAETVMTMAKAGVSQRVIADVIGVSHQRVHQLIRG